MSAQPHPTPPPPDPAQTAPLASTGSMLDRARHWFDQLRNAKPEAGHTAGAVHLSDDEPGRDVRIGAMGAFVFFGLFLGWAALAPLDAAVHAPGTVVVADSRRMVQTQDGGTIDRIHVREGDHVLAGDVLVEMRATEARAERDGLRAQWVELTALRARLLAEETGQRQVPMPPEWHTGLSEAERVDAQPVLQRQQAEMDARRRFLSTQQGILGSRRGQLNAQIGGFGSQRQAYIRQRELLQDELAAVQHLYDRGLAPLSRVRSLERAMAQIEVDLAGLRSSEARAREAIGEATLQGLSLEDQERVRRSEDLRRTDQLLADVAPGLEAARARYERALIRASASGTVVGLIGLTEGAVAPAGGRLMEIVPADDELVIDAQVAPQHADDVAAGMAAEIRFPGLTGRAMPILSGTVETVSADRLLDERSGIPYFTVRVRVDEASLAALNSNHPRGLEALGPGLPAEVLITLRPRTALQYLLEPLDQTLWRSFREA